MSKVTTKITFDANGVILEHSYFLYNGPIALCGGGSGDPVAQQEEASQAAFDTTLQNIFQEQYTSQQAQLNYLKGVLQPGINVGGVGYTATQLANQRTAATDANSQAYQNAQAAVNNQISQNSGGSKLTGVSGATAETDAQLAASEAQTQAGSQEQITQNNAQLQQQNYWNSINALNGIAAQENPLGYASASTSAANSVASNSQASSERMQASTSPLFGVLGGALGGLGTAAGGIWCFVAASFWGWDDLRTWVVRMWMRTEAPVWFRNFYYKHGQFIAGTPLRWLYRPIFEAVLVRA